MMSDAFSRAVEETKQALERNDLVRAYELWRLLLAAHGLPRDWFTAVPSVGESVQ